MISASALNANYPDAASVALLPPEIICRIFSFLPLFEIFGVKRVCSAFNEAIECNPKLVFKRYLFSPLDPFKVLPLEWRDASDGQGCVRLIRALADPYCALCPRVDEHGQPKSCNIGLCFVKELHKKVCWDCLSAPWAVHYDPYSKCLIVKLSEPGCEKCPFCKQDTKIKTVSSDDQLRGILRIPLSCNPHDMADHEPIEEEEEDRMEDQVPDENGWVSTMEDQRIPSGDHAPVPLLHHRSHVQQGRQSEGWDRHFRHHTSETVFSVHWRVCFNEFLFRSKTPHIIVDTHLEKDDVFILPNHMQFPLKFKSLKKALAVAKDGFIIQIRRGSTIFQSGNKAFEILHAVKIYGETEEEYLERMQYDETAQEMMYRESLQVAPTTFCSRYFSQLSDESMVSDEDESSSVLNDQVLSELSDDRMSVQLSSDEVDIPLWVPEPLEQKNQAPREYLLKYNAFSSTIPPEFMNYGIAPKKGSLPSTTRANIPPRPRIFVERNSAIISLAPCILENLVIESGHNCEICNPFELDPYSAITCEHVLILRNSHIVGSQGSGLVARSQKAQIITQYCTFETPYYCIFTDEGCSMVVEECYGNLFAMQERFAIGAFNDNLARQWINELKKTNSFDASRSWI